MDNSQVGKNWWGDNQVFPYVGVSSNGKTSSSNLENVGSIPTTLANFIGVNMLKNSEIDWDEFNDVLAGNGPCNEERLAVRNKAHDDGAWVREAAVAYAEKTKRKTKAKSTIR